MTPLLRQPGEEPRETEPQTPATLTPGYGWCDLHQGTAWIVAPTALDPVTGIHGACSGCRDGRPKTRRTDGPAVLHSA